jgi:two-component system sensor histidine kinase BarA
MAAALEASREGLTRQVEDATRELRETLETVEVQNAELAIAKKEALQASRAKSEFLATMSHELRTPLNGVLGYTNLLLRGELDPGQRERAEVIRRSAESLLGIVNDVLDFSRIEANRLDLRITEVDLRDCVEEVLELLAPRAHDKGLELILHLHSDVPRVVRADPSRLRQILVNLVSNAVKFTEHGSVTVRVQHQGADSDPGLLFTVSDTGVGLSRAQRERLFRSFSQAHDGSAQAEGSGLGLVISRQLAERMQGRLWLESEPGEGTQVRFSIRYEPAAGPAPAREPPGATGTLLLHEPHASQRLSLRDLLMDLGYQVQDTGNARGLARLARSGGPFDGVVLSLPAGPLDPEQVDALEAGAPELGGLPGVVLTSELYSRQSLTLPGHPRLEPLPKPVRAGRLAAALRRLLTDSAPGTAAALPAPPRDELAGIRVLVADDHGVNQRLLATVLAGRGASVEVAGDGREVLRRLSERPCDLVLMDVHMPELDGLAATAMLRSMEAGGKRTPVVGVTADVLGDTREGLLRSGMDDVLTKPVDEEALCRAVRRWVPQPLLTGPGQGGGGEEAAPPVVDDVAAMRSTGGRRDLVDQLRGMLDAELEHALPALAQALGRGDPDAAETAHRIRGGAAHCGAPALAGAAERLEAALRAGSGEARGLLEALEAEAERFRRHARGGQGEAQ